MSITSLNYLTTEQVDQFQRNGFLVIEDLLHQEIVSTKEIESCTLDSLFLLVDTSSQD